MTNNSYYDASPQIHNGQVVWHGDDGNDYEIYIAVPSTPTVEEDLGNDGKDPEKLQGDDVNIINGNMLNTFQDLFIPGKGLAIELSRTYNSQDIYNGPLGYGWTHSYNMSLTENPDGTITERDEDRTGVDFTYDAIEGVYKAWDHSKITKNPDGTYTLIRKHGDRYEFDSSGILISIQDRNQNQVTLGYSGGLLTTITDTAGRVINFTYTGSLLTQITDPAQRTISYSYDADGNLIAVTDPAGNITAYTYDTQHNLTTITDARGNHTYFTYDPEDRCTETKNDQDNQKFSFTYDPVNSTTVMTNANGNPTTFIYDKDKGVVNFITDALGNTTTSTWDANFNRTSITKP